MLKKFHKKCLGDKRECFIPDTGILRMTRCNSTEHVLLTQVRRSGHVIREEDERLPKSLFIVRGPLLRYHAINQRKAIMTA